jgi:excisionase family DNA binding protein
MALTKTNRIDPAPTSRPEAQAYPNEPIEAAPEERQVLVEVDHALNPLNDEPTTAPRLLAPNGEALELPASLAVLLRRLVHDMAQGRNVTIVSRDQLLTTQQAADLLNVSRPHLIKLLEQNAIPYSMTGSHRRIRFDDLIAYKRRRDAERRKGLALLTQLGEEMGDYD